MLTSQEADEVLELIASHAFLYKKNKEELYELFKGRASFFEHLIQLAHCDDLGRFSEGMGKSDLDGQKILEKIKKSYN